MMNMCEILDWLFSVLSRWFICDLLSSIIKLLFLGVSRVGLGFLCFSFGFGFMVLVFIYSSGRILWKVWCRDICLCFRKLSLKYVRLVVKLVFIGCFFFFGIRIGFSNFVIWDFNWLNICLVGVMM